MPHRILVIDDEQPILDLMRAILARDGHEVLCADNGALGLEMYRDKQPNLLIVDIAMPEVNGYHVLDTVRQEEGTARHTPIIILTAFPEGVVNQDVDDKGADLYLTKPISAAELLEFVKRLLQ